jgi:glycosyltransferase involved in cell wall biosynthesis
VARPAIRRILFFSPGWPPAAVANGVATYIANLRGALAECGFASSIAAHEAAAGLEDPEVTYLSSVRRRRTLLVKLIDRGLYAAFPERSALYRMEHGLAPLFRPGGSPAHDIAEIEEAFGLADFVRRHDPAPVVLRLHGPWFLNGPALGVPQDAGFQRRVTQEGRAIARAVAVSAPSRDVLERVRQRYGLDLRDAEVIPNPGPMVQRAERWDAAAADMHMLLFVGRFDRHKGGDLAIDAFHEVAKDNPHIQLCFVGPDRGLMGPHGRHYSLSAYLEERIPDAGLRRRIRVLGPQLHDGIAELRRRACLTLVPSRYENFPMTVLEALAFGSPLIASDAGGIPECVRHAETGLTFRAGDPLHLAARIRLLLSDRGLAARLAANARADYEARFAPSVVARSTANFYERVLEHHAPTADGARLAAHRSKISTIRW